MICLLYQPCHGAVYLSPLAGLLHESGCVFCLVRWHSNTQPDRIRASFLFPSPPSPSPFLFPSEPLVEVLGESSEPLRPQPCLGGIHVLAGGGVRRPGTSVVCPGCCVNAEMGSEGPGLVRESGCWVNRYVREGLSGKMNVMYSSEANKQVRRVFGGRVPGRGNGQCKGPGPGTQQAWKRRPWEGAGHAEPVCPGESSVTSRGADGGRSRVFPEEKAQWDRNHGGEAPR